MPRISSKRKKPPSNGTTFKFRVGDIATVHLANQRAKVRIIEDRGNLGLNGRRLLRVQFVNNDEEKIDFEVPEEFLARH